MDILERMQSLPVVVASGGQFHQVPVSDMAELLDEIVKLREVGGGMLGALRLHKAWSDSERAGPDYGGQTRDTHPDGERIWKAWWNNQLDLCDRASTATDAAISAAEKAGIPFPRSKGATTSCRETKFIFLSPSPSRLTRCCAR